MAAPAPSQSFAPGSMLADRYLLGPVLGRGGMGVVHAADDRQTRTAVAVKLVGVLGQPVDRARAVREAESLERLDHPRIVRVLDRGSLGTVLYLVMERLRGRDLGDRLLGAGPLPLGEAAQIGIDILDALSHAHAAGVVHRDVKPSNVFLTRIGDREEVKVVDFGIAKLLDQAALTRSRQMVGTLRYMAPEQIESARDVREPADVYGLGVVLFQMLTARLPFEGTSYAELVQATRCDVPPALTCLREDVPAVLANCVDRCLAKRPEQRPTLAVLRHALVQVRPDVRVTRGVGSAQDQARVAPTQVATLPPPRPVGGPALDETLPADEDRR